MDGKKCLCGAITPDVDPHCHTTCEECECIIEMGDDMCLNCLNKWFEDWAEAAHDDAEVPILAGFSSVDVSGCSGKVIKINIHGFRESIRGFNDSLWNAMDFESRDRTMEIRSRTVGDVNITITDRKNR